jgi:hypothetical protein
MTDEYRKPEQLAFDFGANRPVPWPHKASPSFLKPLTAKAEIIRFPLARQGRLMAKIVVQVQAARSDLTRENLLRGRLARIARRMRRKRISEEAIAAQLDDLEKSVRAVLRATKGRANG